MWCSGEGTVLIGCSRVGGSEEDVVERVVVKVAKLINYAISMVNWVYRYPRP